MKKNRLLPYILLLMAIPALVISIASKDPSPADGAGLTLPSGFEANIVADNLGSARHIAITNQGDIYVKLNRAKNGKGVLYLHQTGDKATVVNGFGNYAGTGMYIKDGYLYASSNEDVYRYKLNDKGEVINPSAPERIVVGLLNRHEHESKSVVLDNNGNIYVNVGAYSNSCQEKDRQKGSMGRKGCPILDSAGGIWEFKADKLNQHYGDGIRYFVVFQPFKDGKPDGKWEVFADGFAGTQAQKESGNAIHRPCGLAQGPDGSLYVTDDNKGTIYKIRYKK